MYQTQLEFITWLKNRSKGVMKLQLNRMEQSCEWLNHPELTFKTIHIGGTNGKGSTCNDLSHLLQSQGNKVGLFISPYILSFNESIQINQQFISEQDLLTCVNELFPVLEKVEATLNDELSEFEVLTLLSFLYFKKQAVDYAIYEVGLGGLNDATNVIQPIVSGITNIQWDHMGILGDTLEKIALQKIGIAKKNAPVFTTETRPSVLTVFETYCEKMGTMLYPVNKSDAHSIHLSTNQTTFYYEPFHMNITLPMIGMHQIENALLALKIFRYLYDKKEINFETLREGMKQAVWPGRMEVISNDPFIMIDGSHNQEGVKTLVEALKIFKTQGYKIKIIFTALKDKDTQSMIHLLESVAEEIVITTFNYYRAADENYLYEQSQKIHVSKDKDYHHAIEQAKLSLKSDELLLITGSLYFISEVRQTLT